MLGKIHAAALAASMVIGVFNLTFAQETTSVGEERQITNSIGMKLTLVPAGEFLMGGGESAAEEVAFFKENYGQGYLETRHVENEYPQHRVRITKPFFLGTYHVTRGQFRQFVEDSGYMTAAEIGGIAKKAGIFGANPKTGSYEFNADFCWRNSGFEQTDEHPVVHVNWNDAMAFCKWLSEKEGKTYRLPTEAEWEYACRAGTKTRYYSGDDPETLANVANVADETLGAKFEGKFGWRIRASDGYIFTAPVGQFKPNAFGLYDMHGNAGQWCADWYDKDYYSKSPVDDPSGPTDKRSTNSSDYRVLRGGNWHLTPSDTRSATRRYHRLDSLGSEYSGFRVARTQ